MNYVSMKVKEAMAQISAGEIFLPAIQRKFVWGPRKIEALFDSIMRGYPIGTFLFWFVKGDTKNDYTFYRFIQDFHEKDNAINPVAPKPHLGSQFIGVLDGQQRLNSMYVALQGSYSYKRKHGHWNSPASFPQRWLYLNLFYEPSGDDDENGFEYQFAFLAKEEAALGDADHYWFRVKDVFEWESLADVFPTIHKASLAQPDLAQLLIERGSRLLNVLWQRLCADDVINYFSVHDQELDRIVDIFIRVNSTGVPLSKTDLLFSSIVAHWDGGRAEIEQAIEVLNQKGSGFAFDNDFVMRSCLAVADLPVRLKVNSFRKENIERIKQRWGQTRAALEVAVDLLVEWGFSRDTLPAQNAVIPITYFAAKGGDVAGSTGALRQYLIRALLNQIFRSKTDRVLGAILDHLRVPAPDGVGSALASTQLTTREITGMKLPDGRTLRINAEDIEELLTEKKGPYTFIVLSLLYPHLKFAQVQFHQDHIHPWSQFSDRRLRALGLGPDDVHRWQEDRDRLPNLQLLERTENQQKSNTPFGDWMKGLGSNGPYFMATHRIPSGVGMTLKDFEAFAAARRELLREELRAILA